MGRPSSLHEGFVSVKTPMGLERFEFGSPSWPIVKKEGFKEELVLKQN